MIFSSDVCIDQINFLVHLIMYKSPHCTKVQNWTLPFLWNYYIEVLQGGYRAINGFGFFLCLYNELRIKLWWESAIKQQTTLSQLALSMALTLFKGSGHLKIPKRSVSDGHCLWQGWNALALIARKSEWQGTNLQLSWYLKCFGWPKPHFIGLYIMQS